MSRPPTSIRGKARQNLLVATVNVALERQLITLDCQPFKAARFEFELAGLPVLAHVSDGSFDEVQVGVIVCPTELGRRFGDATIPHAHPKFGAATTFGWLERRPRKRQRGG